MDEKNNVRIRSSIATEDAEQFLQQNRFSVMRIQPEKATTNLVKRGDPLNKDPHD